MSFDWHRFVSATARAVVLDAGVDAERAPALVSGLLLGALRVPVLEMPAHRAAALVGYFRACRQQNAVAVVAVEAAVRVGSSVGGQRALAGVAAAAVAARHDGPIVVVARAAQPNETAAATDDRAEGPAEFQLAVDLAAGFGVIGCPAGLVAGDRAALLELLQLADAHGVGIDLELAAGDDVARLVDTINVVTARDPGLPRPVLRGHLEGVEATAPRVVDVGGLVRVRGPLPPGSRIALDAIAAAITTAGTTAGTTEQGDDDVEVRTWLEVSRLLRTVGAGDTVRHLEALAGPALTGRAS